MKIFGSESLVFAIRAAWWLLRRGHWQILHLHAFSYWSIPLVAVALIKRRPIIVKATLLGVDDIDSLRKQPFGCLLTYAFRRVDAVIAISRELASVFESYGWPRNKTLEIPNGVDADLFCPPSTNERAQIRELFGISPDAFVILSVGAISRRKNMASVIEAAARTDGLNPLVIIAGPAETDPECHRELEQLAVDLEGELEVRFTGVLSQRELSALYKASDAYALLSFAEGLPNSVLEAMASGLPVIASDIPGCRDVVSRETGILVSPTEIQEVVDAFSYLACHSVVVNEMGSAARSAILDRYSIQAIARYYGELYESLIPS
jgi:glycosyltransferase involved in cell wall biosynthesis